MKCSLTSEQLLKYSSQREKNLNESYRNNYTMFYAERTLERILRFLTINALIAKINLN